MSTRSEFGFILLIFSEVDESFGSKSSVLSSEGAKGVVKSLVNSSGMDSHEDSSSEDEGFLNSIIVFSSSLSII